MGEPNAPLTVLARHSSAEEAARPSAVAGQTLLEVAARSMVVAEGQTLVEVAARQRPVAGQTLPEPVGADHTRVAARQTLPGPVAAGQTLPNLLAGRLLVEVAAYRHQETAVEVLRASRSPWPVQQGQILWRRPRTSRIGS